MNLVFKKLNNSSSYILNFDFLNKMAEWRAKKGKCLIAGKCPFVKISYY